MLTDDDRFWMGSIHFRTRSRGALRVSSRGRAAPASGESNYGAASGDDDGDGYGAKSSEVEVDEVHRFSRFLRRYIAFVLGGDDEIESNQQGGDSVLQ